MNTISSGLRLSFTLTLVLACWASAFAQWASIDLEEALRLARSRYAGLERDRLSVAQQQRLAQSGLPSQPAQLFLSGEEFDFDGQSGVQSLNLQQNFYLPGAQRTQKEYFRQGGALAEKQLALTDQDVQRRVEQAFYGLQYAGQARDLAEENLELYRDFLDAATAQLESGETGKLPQLAARSRLGQAQLQLTQAEERYRRGLLLFNSWLEADTLYEAAGKLSLPARLSTDTTLQQNPHLQIIAARRELAALQVEVQKSRLQPQINTGVRLQDAFGTFPLFGYQLGVNIPLLRKPYQGRIEAAQVGVSRQEAALRTEQQELERTLAALRSQLQLQRRSLDYLREDLLPVVEEQSGLHRQAYREGEIGYLEYLDSLEQLMRVRQQYLDALYQINALQSELDYWLGN